MVIKPYSLSQSSGKTSLAGLFGDVDLAAHPPFAGIDLSAFPCGLTGQKTGFTSPFDFTFTAILHMNQHPVITFSASVRRTPAEPAVIER